MIIKLKGQLDDCFEDSIILDCNGVGYQVFVPINILQTLPDQEEEISLYIYHHIREDSQKLFGFLKNEERDFFLSLISVSGVGPKVGMKILSYVDISNLIAAIQTGDSKTLTTVPGVGKKVAEKIIIELQDKLPNNLSTLSPKTSQISKNKALDDDLVMALKTLGYKRDEIQKSFEKAGENISSEKTLEENLKVLLKQL